MNLKTLTTLALITVGCAQAVQAPAPSLHLVAFGDSHTYGIGMQPLSWVDHLAKSVFFDKTQSNYEQSFNMDVKIENQAMGGSKFDDRHQYQRLMSYQFKPDDVVVMMLGFNDVVFYGDSRINEFKSQLHQVLSHINNKVLVGTCIKVPQSTYDYMKQDGIKFNKDLSHGSQQACDAYARATEEVVAHYPNAKLVDTNSLDLTEADLIDGVHFKWHIHQKIANMFKDKL